MVHGWFSRRAREPKGLPPDFEAEVRRQIRATPDLSRLVHELGFDVDRAERARALVASLKAAVRAEISDFPALQRAVAAARAQTSRGTVRFEIANRDLLDRIAAAGDDRARVLELLNHDPLNAQLPYLERIPVVRGGVVSWRTPVDHSVISKRPVDIGAFEEWLGECEAIFARPEPRHREPLRLEVREALDRLRREVGREKAYVPTALQFLDRKVEAFLSCGATPLAPARFDELLELLRRLAALEHGLDLGPEPDARLVTELASHYLGASWAHVPSVTDRIVALLLARPYVSVSVWYRRRRFLAVLLLLRAEIAQGHYDRDEVARRLQRLEADGAYFSSLVYPLLRSASFALPRPAAHPQGRAS